MSNQPVGAIYLTRRQSDPARRIVAHLCPPGKTTLRRARRCRAVVPPPYRSRGPQAHTAIADLACSVVQLIRAYKV